ncbi:unnamed protein product [Symbiodinium sp. CCMP2592]|nr:unnamed protein product [Symbiodinium sp. CCMP2592]
MRRLMWNVLPQELAPAASEASMDNQSVSLASEPNAAPGRCTRLSHCLLSRVCINAEETGDCATMAQARTGTHRSEFEFHVAPCLLCTEVPELKGVEMASRQRVPNSPHIVS